MIITKQPAATTTVNRSTAPVIVFKTIVGRQTFGSAVMTPSPDVTHSVIRRRSSAM